MKASVSSTLPLMNLWLKARPGSLLQVSLFLGAWGLNARRLPPSSLRRPMQNGSCWKECFRGDVHAKGFARRRGPAKQ